MNEKSSLEDYTRKKEEILNNRFSTWFQILRDLEMTSEPAHTVVSFPNSSSYVFSTGANTFWMVDPSYARDGEADAETEKIAGLIREKISFAVITHLHADHCQAGLIRQLRDAPIRWLVPAGIAEKFRILGGIAAEKILVLENGSPVEFRHISITAGRGYHDEPGKTTVEASSYEVILPDGVSLFFPGDVRDFDAEISASSPADYIFGHVFLGRDNACGNTFSKLDSFCRFMTRRKSSHLILTHLYETGRPPEDLWTERHAALVSARIAKLAPHLEVMVPHFGDTLHLVREMAPWKDVFTSWSRGEREDFLANLGISVKSDHNSCMDRAIAERIPVVEWSYHAIKLLPRESLRSQARVWRANGGRCLSLHMPPLPLNPAAENEPDFRDAAEIAMTTEMDRITVHVPTVSVAQMKDERKFILERFQEMLSPLIERGILIGIENLHMKPRFRADESRGYGFIPEECLSFAEELRILMKTDRIGIHFDMGHAYSNMPYSLHYTTAEWLRLCGRRINGLHIHQFERAVTDDFPYLEGHRHITGRNTGHPALRPLFDAWQAKIFRAPMILEIMRGPEAEPFSSLTRFRKNIS